MNKTILIAEDEERIRKLVAAYLQKEQFTVLEAGDGEGALRVFEENEIHLVILDIMMPKMDGWEVLSRIRKVSSVPVVMLTAKVQDEDKLLGFQLGTDHYITKPFNTKLLVAMVKSLINRAYNQEPLAENSITVQENELVIDEYAYEVKVNGMKIALSPKEFELLLYFYKNKGLVLTREKILDHIWGIDYFGDLRAVDTQIKRLREKLGDKANLISTVRGVGYKFEAEKNE